MKWDETEVIQSLKRRKTMHSLKKAARIAGAIYLSMVVTGPFSLIYVPNKLIVRGNAAAPADNILAHETMFRLAILPISLAR